MAKLSEKELVGKTKERIKKLMGKGHSPAGAKFLAKQKGTEWSKPKKKNLATRGVEARLRKAGLTEKEIARLR